MTPSDGWALEDVGGLKRTLSDQQERRKRLATYADSLKNEAGEPWTPESIRELQDQVESMQGGTPQDQVDSIVKAKLREAAAKHDKALGDRDSVTKRLESQLRKVLIEGTAAQEIAAAGAGKHIAMLLPSVMSQLDVDGIGGDGVPSVFVKDASGAPRLTTGSGTANMGVGELLAEMKAQEAYQVAFNGSGSSGSGAGQPGAGAPFSGGVIRGSDLRDQHKYSAAKAAAKEAGVPLRVVEG